jgi:hypothetical protein
MTNVTTTLQSLVTYYVGLANWLGLGTGLPGSSTTPANEATGGSPAYARQSTTWNVTGATSLGSPTIFNVPAGTYGYLLLCSGSSGANMVDWCPFTPQVITAQTTITVVPLATAS